MRVIAGFLLLGLGACASSPPPLNNLPGQIYAARGVEPFWALAIGANSIVLTLGEQEARFSRVLPTHVDGVTRWHSEEGTKVITVEAFSRSCRLAGDEAVFPDQVVVSLSGRQLQGCGGKAERGA